MNERREPADAAKPASVASEERLLSSAEEFAASASKTTVFFTNLLQGLLGPNRVGTGVTASVVRGGALQELTVTVGTRE